jgi:uncharacterized repeat protein (TIGR03806 family)
MNRMIYFCLVIIAALLMIWTSCQNPTKTPNILVEESAVDYDFPAPKFLSDYDLFEAPLHTMIPKQGVEPYELNSSLFTDYAWKKRFIYLPEGSSMSYHDSEVMDFPEGTMIFKFFYYPHDFSSPELGYTIMETRVLHLKEGAWVALPYTWNKEQTDAVLAIAGDSKSVSWINHNSENIHLTYAVPNMNQCKSCHEFNKAMMPIGPSARQLNKEFEYSGITKNQLQHFSDIGWLTQMPPLENCPKLPDYNDISVSLDKRARAYLDINCAHCHRPEGPAKNSALHLAAHVTNNVSLGIGKTPIAAGKGSGGLKYDIVPGKPEESILYYRMKSNEPGIMMPEIGRKIEDQEGLALISEWIKAMK